MKCYDIEDRICCLIFVKNHINNNINMNISVQEAINEKFSEYLNTNILSAKQQEFVKSIINYIQQNGDITKQDLVDKSPFSDFDVVGLF